MALNKIYISTFGRGIWQTDVSSIANGIEALQANFNYHLFPTINNGSFEMQFDNNQDEKIIDVIDVMGKMVYTQKTKLETLKLTLNLSSGVYYIRTACKNKVGVKKIVVE